MSAAALVKGHRMTPKQLLSLIRFHVRRAAVGYDVAPAPGLDPEARVFFEGKLRAASAYLEYGSGGTTLLADELGIPTVSVEADAVFAKAVRKKLVNGSVTMKVRSLGLMGLWSRPVFRTPIPRRVARWRAYVTAPYTDMAAFPQLVLVDGRCRLACALLAVSTAIDRDAPFDLMIDDYADTRRTTYRKIEAFLGPPRMIGRAAVYAVDPSRARRPSNADIDEAMADWT